MARADEFDAFYSQTRRHILLQTYVVTGDLGAAAAAARAAYTKAWQRWRRLRTHDDAEARVRHEAWRLASIRHAAHLRRRLDDAGTDAELLSALSDLPSAGLRLLVLQTLAGMDLSTAAREVALTDEAAVRASDAAVDKVQRRLGIDVAQVETRLLRLHAVTDRVSAPVPSSIRRHGRRRQRRTTLVTATGTVLALTGAGLLVTSPAPAGEDTVAAPDRREIGEDSLPVTEPAPAATADQLLDSEQVASLDPKARWQVASTSDRPDRDTVFADCATEPAADANRLAAHVRTYTASGGRGQVAVEAIEVSRTEAGAERGYERLLGWYAGCQVPRVQLIDSFTIRRVGTDVTVLELRKWSTPVRSITVAMTRAGMVTSVLVHEVDGPKGAPMPAVARSVRTAVTRLCGSNGGPEGDPGCQSLEAARPAPPPPTGEASGFLGVVDLPPVGRLNTPWVGTDTASADPNIAATLCDRTDFSAGGVRREMSRAFVLPEENLPTRFGISQTIGMLESPAAAGRFISESASRIRSCPDRQLSATIDAASTVRSGPVVGRIWRLTYELPGGKVFYRVGLVRHGAAVSQVTYSPTPGLDVDAAVFARLVLRAGQRLPELE